MSEMEGRNAPKVFESEYRMCLILWENEPIKSPELAKLCAKRLGWSRTTTYSVIHRLEERGVLVNENAVVRSLYTKEEIQSAEMEEMMEKTFEGSVPAFLAAFAKSRRLSEDDIAKIRAIIDEGDKESGE